MPAPTDLDTRLARVQLLLLDVDGVLTDGGVTWSNDGIEAKTFHIRDGLGLRLWQRAGGRVGLVTGRSSHVVQLRADELGIGIVRQGVDDKLEAAGAIVSACGLEWEETAFMGDDLPGGRGAVREAIERLLRSRGAWEAIVARYAAAVPAAGGARG